MKVRMKTQVIGLINGERWPAAGGEIDLPDAVALQEINKGRAEAVAEPEPKRTEKRPAQAKRETRKS